MYHIYYYIFVFYGTKRVNSNAKLQIGTEDLWCQWTCKFIK